MSRTKPGILTVANGNRNSLRLGKLVRQFAAGFLSSLLVFQPAPLQAQQVTPDATAPIANQPGVGVTPNGLRPLVDIVTPNSQGLSHNKYGQFNVGTPGLVLNNHNGEATASALRDILPGNPNLKNSGPATVILNEVTKANRSSLEGQIEVFGGRADVIIANPNGITCNGCGFINTPGATLTTGTPDIDATGRLGGFTVNGGNITFGEKGGNFAAGNGGVDLFDVVSRSIKVDGKVFGKDLRLTAGRNKFDYATREAKALEAISGTPEYAIDGSALGAMQADRIKIVVTEKGSGVRMSKELAATAGELTLSADGKLSLGDVSGSEGVTLTSKDKITAKAVTSPKRVVVKADKGITLQTVSGGVDGSVKLGSGSGLLSIEGKAKSSGTFTLASNGGVSLQSVEAGVSVIQATSGNIDIKGDTRVADLVITATAGSITSKALTSFNNMTLTAGLDLNTSGSDIAAAGKLSASARSITSGAIASGVNIAATHASAQKAPIFGAVSDLTLVATAGNISSALLFSGGAANLAAANINADGIKSRGDINFAGAATIKGQVLGGANVSMSGATLQSGDIYSGVNFAVTDANGGKIKLGSSGNLTLTASESPAGSGIITAGALVSAGSLTATAKEITANLVTAQGDIALGGNLKVSTEILGASNVALTGTTIKTGIIASGVDLAATDGSSNKKIILGNNGDLTINASGGSLTAAGMLVAGKLTSTAASLSSDAITARRDITLNGDVNVKDQIRGGHNVRIIGHNVTAGLVASGVDFVATAASPSGTIIVGPSDGVTTAGDIVINATSSGIVKTAALLSAGLLDVTAASITAQNITGHKSIRIAANTNVGGQIQAGSNISITGNGIQAGAIISGVDFTATANSPSGDIILRKADSANTGSIAGDLDLNAMSGSIDVAALRSAGNITGNAGQNINANAVSRQALKLSAGNTITLTGQSSSGSDLLLKAGSINVDTLVSGVDFAASTDSSLVLNKNTGAAAATDAMTLDASQGSIKANNLTSGGDLSAHAPQDVTYNSLQSFGTASLAANQGSISLDKTTRAAGDITITTKSVDFSSNRGINLGTAKNLIINADTATFADSTYTWGGLGLTLTGSADFTGVTLNAITNNGGSGNINVKAAGITQSSTSALLAQNDLTLSLASLSNSGQLAAGHNLTFNIASDLTNTPTGLIYAGNDARMYVAGNLLNDQGAIMAGHDLTIAANASNAKNQSVTNISGSIRAENDGAIFSENVTNRRLTKPTKDNVLVSDNVVSKFELNPEMLGKPYALIYAFKRDGMSELYSGLPKLGADETLGHLWSRAKSSDGSIWRASWEDSWDEFDKGHGESYPAQWLLSVIPVDSDSNPILDPANTARYFVIKNDKPGDTFHTMWRWVDTNKISQAIYEDRLTSTQSPEAMIHAGQNLTVEATALNNSFSSIEAGGDAVLKGVTLNNEGIALHRTTHTKCEARGGCEAYNADGTRNATNDLGSGVSKLTGDVAIGAVGGSIKAVGNLDIGGFQTVNNTAAQDSMAGSATLGSSDVPGDPTTALSGLTAGAALFTPNAAFAGLQVAGTPSAGNALMASGSGSFAETLRVNGAALAALSKPNSGGFGGTVPGQIFLYETRAAFLDVGKFYGSGYFIKRIGYNPEHEIPFLGDAHFENQLIDTQMRQLVGQGLGKGSFIPGSDAIEHMKQLLDNGIDYAKTHNLKIGMRLSPEQAAALTQSVVLYEKKIVQGVEVLAPVVYLANADKANLTVAGALISGGSVNMNIGNLKNSGAVAARTDLKLAATNIKANGGAFVAGGNLQLKSAGDLTVNAQSLNIGGTNVVNPNAKVKAGGNASLVANDNLKLQGATVNAGGNADLTGKNITLDVAKVKNRGTELVTGTNVTAGGSIIIGANDNVNIIGSSAKAGGDLGITAESGSVNVVTADVAKQNVETGRHGSRMAATVQQQSELVSGGNTNITAGDDILISGSKIDAGANVTLKADDDINITTAQSRVEKSRRGNSSSSISNTGSEIKAGGSIVVTAGRVTTADGETAPGTADHGGHDINIIGSKLAAGGKVQLKASDDITIAEATDSSVIDTKTSSKRVFSRKEATTHTETTTAVGSSISGGTGVDIESDDDTTISASKVQAGSKDGATTPDNKAALNITTGGDLTIASGKDTLERHDASSGKGFLSKKSAKLESYDERTVASELGASGNINLKAGDDAVIAGSSVKAGGSLAVDGDSVSIIGTPEDHDFASQKKKSGLGAGSGGGFVSIWGKEKKDVQQSQTLNSPSLLSAGKDVAITARETDINVLGSHIDAGQDITLDAKRDVNILPGAENSSSFEQEKKSGFGLSFSSGGGGASTGIGFGSSTDKKSQGSETNAVSSLTAGRDLTITSGRDTNIQAAQIAAERDARINAANNVNLLSAQDKSNYEEVHEKLFAGVTLSVSTSLVSTADSIGDAAKKIGKVSDGYSAANAAFASLKAYDALHSIAKGANLASASLTAGFSYSKDKAQGAASIPVVTTVRGGQSVTIEATSGNLTGHGAQIIAGYDADGNPIVSGSDKAGDISLKAGKNVLLESAQATNENSASSKSAGASIGVSAGVGINGVNAGLTGGFNFGKGSSSANGTTQVNSHVTGSGDIRLESRNDTTLKGAVVSGETVTAKDGGDLNIISVPDTGTSKNKSMSGGLSLGGATGGSLSVSGVQIGGGTGSGETNWITQQSGLISKGKMDVDVVGNTNLEAGKIISETGDFKLETGTLTHKDFEGQKQYEGINVDLGIDLTGGKGTQASPSGNHTLEGSYQLDDTRQTVRSTVGPGEIIIRDGEKQASLEQDAATAPLSGLNRDPDLAYEITKDKHVDLEIYFSSNSVQAAIKAGAAVTEIIGGVLDHVREPALASAIRNKDIDPADALRQMQSGACGEQRGDTSFDFWEWIVPSANAADCTITTITGKPIVIHDREGCTAALITALYNQTAGVTGNAGQFSSGLVKGAATQGEEFVALVSDPSGVMKAVSGVALEFYQDPKAAVAKYGLKLAGSLQEKSLLYVQALANGNYEAAGEALSGLAIELSVKLAAPAVGAGYTAIKTADKIKALKKIDKIAKSAPNTEASYPNLAHPTSSAPANTILGDLDELGRPTGVVSTITPNSLGTGTPGNPAIRPPGFEGAGSNHARGHLLARVLGGAGDDARNLVTLFQRNANHPNMSSFERQVQAAVRNGETVNFRAIPIYTGNNPMPTGVTLTARGSNGFHLDVSIPNVNGL